MVGEELRDLGNGVTFRVNFRKGRPTGSPGYVQLRYAAVMEWVEGRIKRVTIYSNIDEARTAAERLAEERGVDGVGGTHLRDRSATTRR